MAHGRLGRKSVTRIVVFVEGGGDKKEGRARLRKGMDTFLKGAKAAARRESLGWSVVLCGSRVQAYRQFRAATAKQAEEVPFLLVDSEGAVKERRTPKEHLATEDHWKFWAGVGDDQVHLMVQMMETWLIADAEALSRYYGSSFHRRALPKGSNLEEVPKKEVESGLDRATRDTGKGLYSKKKVDHGGDLLARVDPRKVQDRCPHCKRFFDALNEAIKAA